MSPVTVVLVSAAVAGLLALGLPALLRSLPEPAQDPPSVSYLALAGWRPLVPAGLVVCSARTYTRDYHEAVANWEDEEADIWGTVPERVAIAQGPDGWRAASTGPTPGP